MEKRDRWILAGCKLIAEQGMHALNAEHLASIVGSSKSSFYHYFGKLEDFRAVLLEYHILEAEKMATQMEACENYMPDVLHVLIKNKDNILFHKQLRIHRENPIFLKCFTKAYEQVETLILHRLNEYLGIASQPMFAKSFLIIITDNLLMRITKKDFTLDWFKNYTDEVSYLLMQMKSM